MNAMFNKDDLRKVRLLDLKKAAHSLELAQYGTKADIAKRIVMSEGGEEVLKKLISTSRKEVAQGDGRKVTFMKKERARLVASGVTDKMAIAEELKRLWTMNKVARQHWKLVQQAFEAAPWVKHWIHEANKPGSAGFIHGMEELQI